MLKLRFPGEAYARVDEISVAVARMLELGRMRAWIHADHEEYQIVVPEVEDYDRPVLFPPHRAIASYASEDYLMGRLDAAATFYASKSFSVGSVLGFITMLCEVDSWAGDRCLRVVLEHEARGDRWFNRAMGDETESMLARVMSVLRAHGKTDVAPDPYTKVVLPSGEVIEW